VSDRRTGNDPNNPRPDREDRLLGWMRTWKALYPIASFTVATFFMGGVVFGKLGQQQAEFWAVIFALYGFVPVSLVGTYFRRRESNDDDD
jgi:hypothetical protein